MKAKLVAESLNENFLENFEKDIENMSQEEKDETLIHASKYGRAGTVKLALDAGANVRTKKDYALQIASEKGYAEIVKMLLDAGANARINKD
jgi:hypothetical protein